MAVTRLVRKALRNRTVSRKRQEAIKRLTTKPVIKNVDIEQIKEEFAKIKSTPAPKKEAPVKEEPKVEAQVEKEVAEVAAAPVAEVKEETKAAAPKKKAAPKAKKEAAPKAEKKEKKSE
jgi:hypothetical protein